MRKLLNKTLYQQLCDRFGRGNVGLHKPGQRGAFVRGEMLNADGQKEYRLTRLDNSRYSTDSGEEYNISCPFCAENRPGKTGRLYINHMWGTRDPYNGSRILRYMHCYNEECQQNYDNRMKLAEMVLEGGESIVVYREDYEPPEAKKAVMPRGTLSLRYLAENDPSHPAVVWCIRRGYDPIELSNKYNVVYCDDETSTYSPTDRLVVPYYEVVDGEPQLAGWTARRLQEPTEGMSAEEKEALGPKWRHSANPTGHIVYGLAAAAKKSTIVVVEGPGDKWIVGDQGVAVLGKKLPQAKLRRIIQAMKPHGDNAKIVIAFDPSQDQKARLRKERHHITSAVMLCKQLTKVPVYDLWLPRWTDPGGLSRSYIWTLINQRLEAPPA